MNSSVPSGHTDLFHSLMHIKRCIETSLCFFAHPYSLQDAERKIWTCSATKGGTKQPKTNKKRKTK